MKKLMFAVAALAAGVACAEITSANVVGYQTKDTVEGFNFMAPTFQPVGGGEVHIQDIKLDKSTAESWADNIQVLDEGGATVATYYYATADESGYGVDGWLSEDGGSIADITIPEGSSVIVETSNKSSVTFAGQVGATATVVTSVAGFNFVGNTSPVAIDIQTIVIDPAMATSWADNIQILDEGGATVATYYYAIADESGYGADGWLSEDGGSIAEVEIPAGLGFIVETENAGVTITLPAAL